MKKTSCWCFLWESIWKFLAIMLLRAWSFINLTIFFDWNSILMNVMVDYEHAFSVKIHKSFNWTPRFTSYIMRITLFKCTVSFGIWKEFISSYFVYIQMKNGTKVTITNSSFILFNILLGQKFQILYERFEAFFENYFSLFKSVILSVLWIFECLYTFLQNWFFFSLF